MFTPMSSTVPWQDSATGSKGMTKSKSYYINSFWRKKGLGSLEHLEQYSMFTCW